MDINFSVKHKLNLKQAYPKIEGVDRGFKKKKKKVRDKGNRCVLFPVAQL